MIGNPLKPVCTFNVSPCLPNTLKPLMRIALNLRWSWDHEAIELFRRLDPELWEKLGHNPISLLGNIDQSVLEAASRDEAILAHVERVSNKLDTYVSGVGTWYSREQGKNGKALVAYFSAEFGITECLSIFAGGLGVLAGDHLKAASDLGVPLVGIGLLYQQGYFRQYLNAAGWQQEAYEDNDFHTFPIQRVPDIVVNVDLPDGPVAAQVWRADVGRLQLFLLDTNVPQNRPQARDITDQLYGGDLETRIRQEIVLGIGGYRALEMMGFSPTVYHMNEGHSAFLALERVCRLRETRGLSFQEARRLASASLIFTTHTPVPAGHDYFPPALMDRYFPQYPARLGIDRNGFLGLGRQDPQNQGEDFCMTVLALRLAAFSNGVSKLHGEVSRKMWERVWPGTPEFEIPIGHVTNGVHFRTWVSYDMNQLYDRYLGPKWREEPADPTLWKRSESIPAEELWRTHERRRERLVAYARQLLKKQLISRGSPQSEIDAAEEALSPDALTIGFGRRFAVYKRANLLLSDPDRLLRLLKNPERPVQIIYAGKAHPNDAPGKKLIQNIIDLARKPEFRRHIVFLENYDMAVARYMVQGCDVWLNTPRRPLEASGTSGMKAQANGVLNVSTLDGWWDEAWRMGDGSSEVGWAIGHGESYQDDGYQDKVEAEALYKLLESDVAPTFYDRRADGLPRRWIARMKFSIAKLCPEFNMHRMVTQYTQCYYEVAHARYLTLEADNAARTKELVAWLHRIHDAWSQLHVESVQTSQADIQAGGLIHIRVEVRLGPLKPSDVTVQVVLGPIDADGQIKAPTTFAMTPDGEPKPGTHAFDTQVRPSTRSGLHGFTVRVLPHHADLITPHLPTLVTWADGPKVSVAAAG